VVRPVREIIIAPRPDEFEGIAARIAPYVLRTPAVRWASERLSRALGGTTQVWAKLELFQHTGTFKARGAIANVLDIPEHAIGRGLTTVSGGNHAIAVAYAARCRGTSAKVVMMSTANVARIEAARALGAEVLLTDRAEDGFAMAHGFEAAEGRTYVHGFDGPNVTLATGTLAMEFLHDAGELDAIIVPVGGGGLSSGIAAFAKQHQPSCRVFGVQPAAAGAMLDSLQAGRALSTDRMATIADSLASPKVGPFSLAMAQRFLDEVVTVSEDELAAAVAVLFADMKLAVEPAAAASTAALLGPLRERVRGMRVGVIVCGSNIDWDTYASNLARGRTALSAGVLG
jgi:threonine dehydratase